MSCNAVFSVQSRFSIISSLPYSAVSWSALSDYGITWSYLHFGHFLFITIKISQFYCVSCLTVCQCTQK